MKKQKVAKRKPLSMVIDLKRLIEESGVSYNSSIPDKLIVSSELIKKISFDIYQLGYLTLEVSEELGYTLDKFFNKHLAEELNIW